MKTKAADLNYTRHSATVNSEGFVTLVSRHPFLEYKQTSASTWISSYRHCLFILPTCLQFMQWYIPRLVVLIAALVEIVLNEGINKPASSFFNQQDWRRSAENNLRDVQISPGQPHIARGWSHSNRRDKIESVKEILGCRWMQSGAQGQSDISGCRSRCRGSAVWECALRHTSCLAFNQLTQACGLSRARP